MFITPLIRARINGYGHLLYRQRHFAPAVKENFARQGIDGDHYCCSCDEQTRDTLHHLGMECAKYTQWRATYLDAILEHFRTTLQAADINPTSEELWMLCLGGTGFLVEQHTSDALFTQLTNYWIYAGTPTDTPPPYEDSEPPPPPLQKPPFHNVAAYLNRVMTCHTRAINAFLGRCQRPTKERSPSSQHTSNTNSMRAGPSLATGNGPQKSGTQLKQSKLLSLWRKAGTP